LIILAAATALTVTAFAGSAAAQGVYGTNWPLLAAGVLMIALPMVVFFIFMQRYISGGVTAGAVKG
jgi:raffinose/stachyose/melibiose transport system permease protein